MKQFFKNHGDFVLATLIVFAAIIGGVLFLNHYNLLWGLIVLVLAVMIIGNIITAIFKLLFGR